MIWYYTNDWNTEIKEREIVKATEKTVAYISEYFGKKAQHRELKSSSCRQWFKTKEEAIEFLRKRLETKVFNYSRDLGLAQAELEKFNQEYPKGPKCSQK